MKRILLVAVMLMFASGIASAQRYCAENRQKENGYEHRVPFPHRSIRPHVPTPCNVSFDAVSTVLTVKFTSNLHGGTVEVYRDGAKVAGITTNGGTTFSCRLHEYGAGNYAVIVSNGNTVVESKSFTVK